jgi:hypothetical protein
MARVKLCGIGLGLLLAAAGCGQKKEPPKADPGTGVAECDAYFKANEACLAKNPGLKTALENAAKANREAWVKAAATPAGKASLKVSCKDATEALKPTCP